MAKASKTIRIIDVPVVKIEQHEKAVGITLELTWEEAVYIRTILGHCNQLVVTDIQNQFKIMNIPRCDLLVQELNQNINTIKIATNERELLHEVVRKAGLGEGKP